MLFRSREVEKLVRNLGKPAKEKKNVDKSMDVIYEDIQEKLKNTLGTKVAITSKGNGTGKIEIEFYSNEELERLIDIFNGRK